MDRSLKKQTRDSKYKKRSAPVRPRLLKDSKRTPTPWDQAAQWYDTLVGVKGSDFQKEIIMPGVFRMLGLKKGQRVLDLACGQGVFSRYLHQKGMRVTGLDSSRELIRYAVKRSDLAIKYKEGDAGDPLILKDRKFDAVACLLAIQNMMISKKKSSCLEFFRMLGLKKGQRVLDLACGQGVFSRYLHQKGMRVTGLDSSRELIRYAVKRSDLAIKYKEGDAGDPLILKDRKFDAVACLLAIQNMETINAMLKNVHRWLESSGRLVLVMTHPCFRIPRQTHWGWDEAKKTMYRRVDLYSTETKIPILTPPMRGSEVYTQTYHRPLQSYIQSLSQAGLHVDILEEWASNKNSEPGKRSKAENRVRREIPLFMALRAVVAG